MEVITLKIKILFIFLLISIFILTGCSNAKMDGNLKRDPLFNQVMEEGKGKLSQQEYEGLKEEIISSFEKEEFLDLEYIINEYGLPRYNLYIYIKDYQSIRRIVAYQVSGKNNNFIAAFSLRSKDSYNPKGGLIDPNIDTCSSEDSDIWPGWNLKFSDLIEKSNEVKATINEINSLVNDERLIPLETIVSTRLNNFSAVRAEIMNEKIWGASVYKYVSEDSLIITAVLDPEFKCPNCQFLVRLYDESGNQIDYFTSEKMFRLLGMQFENYKFPLVLNYKISNNIIERVNTVEFGYFVN